MSTTQSSKSRLVLVLCITALFSLVGIGCSSDDLPGVDTSTYYGLGSDPSNVPIQISLEGTGLSAATSGQPLGSSSGISLSGTITPAGQAPISVEGFYDTGSGSFAFEDISGTWSFAGTASGITVSGNSSTPNGFGAFMLFIGATPSSVTIYCGTGSCTSGCKGSVGINLVVGGTTAIMTANLSGVPAFGGGTVTGSSVHFDVTLPGLTGVIDGTIASGAITNGTWSASNGDAGVWDGTTAQCTTPPTN